MDTRFLILDTEEDSLVEVEHGAFTVGIREFGGVGYVVGVLVDEEEYLCGLYPTLDEAQQAVTDLMTFTPTAENSAFVSPPPSEPATALEVLTAVNAGAVL